MIRLLLLAATTGMVAGCGTIECNDTDFTCDGDNRPATLEYVTSTILRPYCANGACHSAFAYTFEYRFDTVDHANFSLQSLVIPGDSEVSFLCCGEFSVLVRETGASGELPRMPYDQPLPTTEIALIKRWIDEGADGLVVVQP